MVSVDVKHHAYLLTRLKPELHDVKVYNIHIMYNQQHVFAMFLTQRLSVLFILAVGLKTYGCEYTKN